MKILLIGDSIRKGYDEYVKKAFEGIAEVYYPEENCRFTSYIIRQLYEWKMSLDCGDDVDLVHWNSGLWDDLIMVDDRPLISLDSYKENIERICQMIKILFPKAKMIFATSTPVIEEKFTLYKRYNKTTQEYNAAAVAIVRSCGGEINDLYATMLNAPKEYHSDITHFYTKEGTRLISEQVKKCIETALGIKGRELDYDALFAPQESIGV